jgi:hypothetical protein
VRKVSVGPRFIIDQPKAISSPSYGAKGDPRPAIGGRSTSLGRRFIGAFRGVWSVGGETARWQEVDVLGRYLDECGQCS